MRRPRLLALVPSILACNVSTGAYLEEHVAISGEGRSSRAFHLAVRGVYDQAGGGYQGTLTNRDPDTDCTAAFYRFVAEPRPDDLPVLHPGDLAPTALPGGGTLMGQRLLPRRGEHEFVVPAEGADYWVQIGESEFGDPEIDEWAVILTCPEAEVAIDLDFVMIVNREGREAPAIDAQFLTRLW